MSEATGGVVSSTTRVATSEVWVPFGSSGGSDVAQDPWTTARYCVPDLLADNGDTTRVASVAPSMSRQPLPSFSCHWIERWPCPQTWNVAALDDKVSVWE